MKISVFWAPFVGGCLLASTTLAQSVQPARLVTDPLPERAYSGCWEDWEVQRIQAKRSFVVSESVSLVSQAVDPERPEGISYRETFQSPREDGWVPSIRREVVKVGPFKVFEGFIYASSRFHRSWSEDRESYVVLREAFFEGQPFRGTIRAPNQKPGVIYRILAQPLLNKGSSVQISFQADVCGTTLWLAEKRVPGILNGFKKASGRFLDGTDKELEQIEKKIRKALKTLVTAPSSEQSPKSTETAAQSSPEEAALH